MPNPTAMQPPSTTPTAIAIPRDAVPVAAERFGADRILQRICGTVSERFVTGAYELKFQALGTNCRVSCSASPGVARECGSRIVEWVANFEAKYSRFQPDSLIS